MDTTEPRRGASDVVDPDSDPIPASPGNPQELPDDLPKSLDDRRSLPVYQQETEMYDAWQGMCSCSACRSNIQLVLSEIASQAWTFGLRGLILTMYQQGNRNFSLLRSPRNPYPSASPSMTTHMTRSTIPALATWKTATLV